MRRWFVRMVIESNTTCPDRSPYYDDREMPKEILEWFHGVLEDRDDGPHITWSEFVMSENPAWRVCLHKDHDEESDVTRMCDQARAFLGPCGGVRWEARP